MARLNRTCVVCGEKYSYCPSCGHDLDKPKWMTTFCSDNCRDVYRACAGYYAEQLNKDEVKEILEQCDLSKKEHFTDATQKVINKIYEDDAKKEMVNSVKKERVINKNNYNKRNKKR